MKKHTFVGYLEIYGFTMVELLVVIAIIVILISASLIGLTGSRESARDAKRRTDLEAMRSTLELFRADNNFYPYHTSCYPTGGYNFGCLTADLVPNYISSLPADPLGDDRYMFTSTGCSEVPSGSGNWQCTNTLLCTYLEGGGGGYTGGCTSIECGASINCNFGIPLPY